MTLFHKSLYIFLAKVLNRHHATISRELRRNRTQEPYRAEFSQEGYAQRCKASVSAGKWTQELANRIKEKLNATWSNCRA